MPPLVSLTTDFGGDSPYVAQMKGVLLRRLPDATLVDITHAVPSQDVMAAAISLADTLPWFPSQAVHIGVVDPGVGTDRRILAGRLRDGWFVGPDNGLFSLSEIREAVSLQNPQYWQAKVSDTFHGRDIMAPVAAAIASGVPLQQLGPAVHDWAVLSLPEPRRQEEQLLGQVIHVDSFGNLITNLKETEITPDAHVTIGGEAIPMVRCYGEASAGELVALIGSAGRLEIAVVNGSAEAAIGGDRCVTVINR